MIDEQKLEKLRRAYNEAEARMGSPIAGDKVHYLKCRFEYAYVGGLGFKAWCETRGIKNPMKREKLLNYIRKNHAPAFHQDPDIWEASLTASGLWK